MLVSVRPRSAQIRTLIREYKSPVEVTPCLGENQGLFNVVQIY